MELEKRAVMSNGQDKDRETRGKTKIPREVRNLSWGLSNGKGGETDGDGSVRTRELHPCAR